MHCTIVADLEERRSVATEIWAKGDNVRGENTLDGGKIITIQRGDTLSTYRAGSITGKKERLGSGWAAMGVIRQIERVKTKGQKVGSIEIEREVYDHYEYRARTGTGVEIVSVTLSERTSVPVAWSSMSLGGNKASTWTVHFKDAQANIDMPDEMFRPPPEIKFSK